MAEFACSKISYKDNGNLDEILPGDTRRDTYVLSGLGHLASSLPASRNKSSGRNDDSSDYSTTSRARKPFYTPPYRHAQPERFVGPPTGSKRVPEAQQFFRLCSALYVMGPMIDSAFPIWNRADCDPEELQRLRMYFLSLACSQDGVPAQSGFCL